MAHFRLIVALILPSALVAVGMMVVRDVRAAFGLYAFAGCLLGPWLLLGIRPFSSDGGLQLHPPGVARWRRPFVEFLVFFTGLFAGYALLRGFLVVNLGEFQARIEALGWNQDHVAVYSVVFLLVIPLVEEWWWRAQALPRCVRAFGRWPGIVISGVTFAAYHGFVLAAWYEVPSVLLRISVIAGAGVYWGWLAHRTQSWKASYLGHFGADLAVVLAFRLFFLGSGGE